MSLEYAKKFMELFAGLDRAHGVYSLKRTKKVSRIGEKIVGKAITVQSPVTEYLWLDHLEGRNGIGIIPIQDDCSCQFGAIDIDVYNIDISEVAKNIIKQDLPLVPCRTKSGGIHCFCFIKEKIPASIMREKLNSFASLLGYGGCEIFPKQEEILSDRGDMGQWINMPYFNGDATERYGIDAIGNPMSMKDFLNYAFLRRMSAKEFIAYTISVTSDISDGPPCLQYMLTQGFSTGSRNDGLFCLAVYLKKSDPDCWRTSLDEYNTKYFNPPLSSQEVQNVVKSIAKHDYAYTCEKNPMKQHCNKILCMSRKFGIGQLQGTLVLTGLTKYDTQPPIWFVDVEGGGRLELTTEDLQNQGRFQKRCMDSLNMMPPIMKSTVWQIMIQNLLENVLIIEAPADASPRGMLFEYLEKFCTMKAQARDSDGLLIGKPWTTDDYHVFRMIDFIAYLERQRFYEFKSNKISSLIKEIGGTHDFINIKGKGVNIWQIPKFNNQVSEPLSTPDFGQDSF